MAGNAPEHNLPVQLAEFDTIELSLLQTHQRVCCSDTRDHLLALLCAAPDVGAALASVPAFVTWAPTRWPAFWCDLRTEDGARFAGDCGVHAHIASHVLGRFGIPHARGRIAIRVNEYLRDHWKATWTDGSGDPRWIADDLVHHEALRLLDRWWDPSEACWFDGPGDWLDCGRVVAVRNHDGKWDVAPFPVGP